jgi:rod shape determining protein RodA
VLAFQIIINIGMVLGLMPIVGMPLPFMSYGGSVLLSQMIGVGLILNVRMRRYDI